MRDPEIRMEAFWIARKLVEDTLRANQYNVSFFTNAELSTWAVEVYKTYPRKIMRQAKVNCKARREA